MTKVGQKSWDEAYAKMDPIALIYMGASEPSSNVESPLVGRVILGRVPLGAAVAHRATSWLGPAGLPASRLRAPLAK